MRSGKKVMLVGAVLLATTFAIASSFPQSGSGPFWPTNASNQLLIDVLFGLQLLHQVIQIVLLIVGGCIPRRRHLFRGLVELTL